MYRYLLLFTLLLTTVCKSQSKDSIKLSRSAVERIYAAALQRDVLVEQVTLLNSRISQKDSIINILDRKDSNNSSIVKDLEQQKKEMQDQRLIFEQMVADKNKEIKKYKRKLFWTHAAAITIAGVGTYLYISK